MQADAFKLLYLVGLVAAEGLRFPHRIRRRQDWKRNTMMDLRLTGLERLLLVLAVVGMWLIPAFYAFTPWMDVANYRLPGWVGWLGAAVFLRRLVAPLAGAGHLGRQLLIDPGDLARALVN